MSLIGLRSQHTHTHATLPTLTLSRRHIWVVVLVVHFQIQSTLHLVYLISQDFEVSVCTTPSVIKRQYTVI